MKLFVSFSWKKGSKDGVANAVFDDARLPKNFEDIELIQNQLIKGNGYDQVVVTNYIQMQ